MNINPKIIGAGIFIVGIVSLLGSLVIMYALILMGSVTGYLSSVDPAFLTQYGADEITMRQTINMLNLALIIGWVWIICTFFASVSAIYFGFRKIKPKKK